MRRNRSENLLPTDYRTTKRRGQVAVLFALVIPLLFLILGLVLDLGWYYLNVSRLQNAADAAAVAGAQTIMDSEYFSGYKSVTLVGKYPAKVSNEYRVSNIYELTAIENGNSVAEEYVTKNLSSESQSSLTDSLTKAEVQSNKKLYEKGDDLYYVVKLKEGVQHFLLPGWFDDMAAPVTAVALISKRAVVNSADEDDTPDMPEKPEIPDIPETPETPDTPDTPETPETPPVVEKFLSLIFDANGGTLPGTDDGTTETLQLKEDEDGKVSKTVNRSAEREDYIFLGWNTQADGSGKSYQNGDKITEQDFIGDSLTLYAQWAENIPEDNTIPEEVDAAVEPEVEGNSIYAVMRKGYYADPNNITGSTPDYQGHEMTKVYKTWAQIWKEENYNESNANKHCFRPTGGGSIYNGDYMRTETTSIANTQTIYDDRAFLDLGSDLMWDDDKSNTEAGLFKTSWDISVAEKSYSGNIFNSIIGCANENTLNSTYNDNSSGNEFTYYTGSGRSKTKTGRLKFNFTNNKTSTTTYAKALRHRVHTRFNINGTFSGSDTNPLWFRIESEELNEADGDKQNTTVRQIFINVNADNTGSNARPLVIFYDGPDRAQLDGDLDADKTQTVSEKYPNLRVRDPLPVILNLNKDFKGILFAPNSPVVIIGNGHKMIGFVVAKSFVQLGTTGNKVNATGNDPQFYVDSYGNVSFDTLPTSVIRRPYSKVFRNKDNGSYTEEYDENTLNAVEDKYKEANFNNFEWVYKAQAAFNLSEDSRYASFGIHGLKRNIYIYI